MNIENPLKQELPTQADAPVMEEPKDETKKHKLEKSEKDNKYEVMTPEDVESYKEWVKKKIPEWHDGVKPDYVLLCETSAVPLGWILKSAWKGMYPNEAMPKFFKSDIGSEGDPGDPHGGLFRMTSLYEDPSQIIPYIEKRRLDKTKTVLIFDESSQKPGEKNYHPLKIDADRGIGELRMAQGNTLERNAEFLYKNGIKNIWTDLGCPEGYFGGLSEGVGGYIYRRL